MSNLAQFLSQYNNSGGTELVNNGAIEMAGSPINRYVALTSLNSATINAITASLNTYLNIESLNSIMLSTATPPTRTTGVQLNIPVNSPQQLIDNSVAQGVWQPYTSVSPIPYASRATYGRATALTGHAYKASLVLNANCVVIVTAANSGQTLYVTTYNPNTRAIGNVINIDANADLHSGFGTGIQSGSAVVKLFAIDSSRFLLALSTSDQVLGGTTSYNQGFGCIVCSADASNVLTKGTANRQTTAVTAPQVSYGMGAEIVQLSTTSYAWVVMTSTTQITCYAVSVSGTTLTFGAGLNTSISIGCNIADVIPVTSTSFVVGGNRGPLTCYLANFNVSGTTVTLGTYTAQHIAGDGSASLAIPTIIKVDATNFVQYGRLNSGSFTFYTKAFTISGGVYTGGAALTFGVGTTTSANQTNTRDYLVMRTDAFKVRSALASASGSGNPIFTNGTLAVFRNAGGPLMFTISGGTVTSANGSNLTESSTFGTTNTPRVWPLADGSKLYMSDYNQTSMKQVTISGGVITAGADYPITPPLIADYPYGPRDADGYIISDNFGFGTYKLPSGIARYYALNIANKYNLDVNLAKPAFTVEAALTATGSAVIVCDQVRRAFIPDAPTGVYLLDGVL